MTAPITGTVPLHGAAGVAFLAALIYAVVLGTVTGLLTLGVANWTGYGIATPRAAAVRPSRRERTPVLSQLFVGALIGLGWFVGWGIVGVYLPYQVPPVLAPHSPPSPAATIYAVLEPSAVQMLEWTLWWFLLAFGAAAIVGAPLWIVYALYLTALRRDDRSGAYRDLALDIGVFLLVFVLVTYVTGLALA